MTIASNISTLGTAISDVKAQIINKGQTVLPTDTVASLASKIDNISNKNGENFSKKVLKDVVEGTIENLYDTQLIYIRPYCFTGCDKLHTAHFTQLKKICKHAFDKCFQLRYLILSGDFVYLESSNALKHTLIDKNLGKIFVKDTLVSKYKSQYIDNKLNEWSYFASHIESINNYSV